MFSTQVIIIFGNFASKNDFLIKEINHTCVNLVATDFDIIVSYDDREDEIYIDFDLSKYFKIIEYPQELQFPIFLNIDNVSKHMEVSSSSFIDNKRLQLMERLKIKFEKFEIIWDNLILNEDYEDFLSSILIKERIEMRKISDLQNMKTNLEKARNLFKTNDYKRVIELLSPHKEKLSAYDLKILKYSLKKMDL